MVFDSGFNFVLKYNICCRARKLLSGAPTGFASEKWMCHAKDGKLYEFLDYEVSFWASIFCLIGGWD